MTIQSMMNHLLALLKKKTMANGTPASKDAQLTVNVPGHRRTSVTGVRYDLYDRQVVLSTNPVSVDDARMLTFIEKIANLNMPHHDGRSMSSNDTELLILDSLQDEARKILHNEPAQ